MANVITLKLQLEKMADDRTLKTKGNAFITSHLKKGI